MKKILFVLPFVWLSSCGDMQRPTQEEMDAIYPLRGGILELPYEQRYESYYFVRRTEDGISGYWSAFQGVEGQFHTFKVYVNTRDGVIHILQTRKGSISHGTHTIDALKDEYKHVVSSDGGGSVDDFYICFYDTWEGKEIALNNAVFQEKERNKQRYCMIELMPKSELSREIPALRE